MNDRVEDAPFESNEDPTENFDVIHQEEKPAENTNNLFLFSEPELVNGLLY